MAETTQLLNQANAGSLSLEGLDQFMNVGTPNINQPQAAPDTGSSSGFSIEGLDASMGSQPQQQALPQEQPQYTTQAQEEPSIMGDIIAPTAYEAGKLIVQATIPTVLTIAGGALGAFASPVGSVAGMAAGGAAGTYINDLLGIQDADVIDYTLAAGLPLAGKAMSKAGKAALTRLPAVQKAQQQVALRLSRSLDDLVIDKPAEQLVKGAFQHLDDMGHTLPVVNFQADVKALSKPTNKLLLGQLKKFSPELAEALEDQSIVVMKPKDMREYVSSLKTLRQELLASKQIGTTKQSKEIGDLIKQANVHLDALASTGDPGAIAMKTANKLYQQQQTHTDLKLVMNQAINTKTVDGELVESIDVAKLWDRVRKIEGLLDAGRNSKDKLTSAVIALRDNPETLKTFKEGLKRIAKLTPDSNLLIIPQTGGGMFERTARAAGKEVNTGSLATLLSSPFGQSLLEKIVTKSGGKLNRSSLAAMMAAIRPTISGVLPDQDPLMQNVMGMVQEGVQLSKNVRQKNTGNAPVALP